jgi:hypothetical protein
MVSVPGTPRHQGNLMPIEPSPRTTFDLTTITPSGQSLTQSLPFPWKTGGTGGRPVLTPGGFVPLGRVTTQVFELAVSARAAARAGIEAPLATRSRSAPTAAETATQVKRDRATPELDH